ncbi:MAG: adenine deaminase, partial [Spirochaetia bacterium]|nr:adenine deaminase [Spirochaetia bacterium]
VTEKNSRRCLFCTDDRQPMSILEQGHINNNVRLAVSSGLSPIEAICMATINSCDCYHLDDRGAIAPGLRADFLLIDDLDDFPIHQVYVKGVLVAEEGRMIKPDVPQRDLRVERKMQVKNFSQSRLQLRLKSNHVRIIEIISGKVVTKASEATVTLKDGVWVPDPNQDIVKLAVVERHQGTGNVALALLKGYGLKNGAIATSVAHDSHNLIVCGDNDTDMAIAIEHLIEIGGGMVLVKNKAVLASFAHPVAGLMSYKSAHQIASAMESLHQIAQEQLSVSRDVDPFMTLCFMSLPVIPAYKLTDMGLFDVRSFSFVPLEIQ